ncbi:hypothetical protein BHU16_01065 [Tannerella sp. oral taxon 808]|nr:hypothetical protein BHU16_01065 [Tannerella sp. oral taxon 808]
MKYLNTLPEEEIKNRIRRDYFSAYEAAPILGKIDFAVAIPPLPLQEGAETPTERIYLLWAEAKKGTSHDIDESLVQLILTIGRARTFDQYMPPAFLGAFDAEKIAFVPYDDVRDIFYQNDFNWNVKPSDHRTREFRLVMETVRHTLEQGALRFRFDTDDEELRLFIRKNFVLNKTGLSKLPINKTNFTAVYARWRDAVRPSIAVNWEITKRRGIIDADFFLADLLSEQDFTLREKLYVLLRKNHYELDRKIDDMGLWDSKRAQFNDEGRAHAVFWNRYERPPRREYWDYIVARRDLLVPQDVRERKGSYFTPRQWVELSQQYLSDELGEDWQEEYDIWDCCAGTGNLLAGLTNKYRIWASTLDQSDVDVMHDRIANGANLLDSHVFRFDFLNDSFDLLPDGLREIINSPERRRKLVIYINPPYAEAGNRKVIVGSDYKQKTGVAVTHFTYQKYLPMIGIAGRELFAQFFIRIYSEIPSSVLAEFSKLKILQAPNFRDFRKQFRAKLGRIFLVPANTFDNVKGQFPIGFKVWNTAIQEEFEQITADVYDEKGDFQEEKNVYSYSGHKYIINWLRLFYDKQGDRIAYLRMLGTDFQHNNGVFVTLSPSKADIEQVKGTWITQKNLLEACIYFAVRLCIPMTWLNDRDQFLYPNDGWAGDTDFQNDCLVFTLFHGQNRISSAHGINHWIPFSEAEVGAQDAFKSHFMYDFIRGKLPKADAASEGQLHMFGVEAIRPHGEALTFSPEATAAMDAGRALWQYYHSQPDALPDASLYDIRLHFQGVKTNKSGKTQMNTDSSDATYTALIKALRARVAALARKIEPKVYAYGFLK